MKWMNQVRGILGRYTDRQPGQTTVTDFSTVYSDFDSVSHVAPRSALVEALEAAFRSWETPSFSETVGRLFSQSNNHERAELLNLLASAKPASATNELLAFLAGNREISPEEAEWVSRDYVQRITAELEMRDEFIISKVSAHYAEQPRLLKKLDIQTLAFMMSKIGEPLRGRSGAA